MNTARKLGKRAPRHDPRTFSLARYVTPDLPVAPTRCDWAKSVPTWPMYANDRLGDCVIAGMGHQVEAWTGAAGKRIATVDEATVIKVYSAITGYDPNDPNTDNGTVELDALNYWRRKGIGGHRIGAFASVHPSDRALVRDGVYLFGGLFLGLALPISAQSQSVWDVPVSGPHGQGAPGSWGGHCVIVTSYDERYVTCVTWGALMRMTWAFFTTYVDEAYAAISNDFLTTAGKAPNGFDVATLRADLSRVSSPT